MSAKCKHQQEREDFELQLPWHVDLKISVITDNVFGQFESFCFPSSAVCMIVAAIDQAETLLSLEFVHYTKHLPSYTGEYKCLYGRRIDFFFGEMGNEYVPWGSKRCALGWCRTG